MTILQWAGPVTGLVAAMGAVYSIFVQSRRGSSEIELDKERLGHEELLSALVAQRDRIDHLEARAVKAEKGEAECRTKVTKLEQQISSLLWNLEKRFPQ